MPKTPIPLERSFATSDKARFWSSRNPDQPNDLTNSSHDKRWFDCDNCPHSFESSLSNITYGKWCPYCAHNGKLCDDSDCDMCFMKSFASNTKAQFWSTKNTDSPRDCRMSSNKKKWFDCDKCHHSFDTALNHISSGKWCPYCCVGRSKLCDDSNCRQCFTQSFAVHPRSKQWSKRNPDTPRECAIGSSTKRWFDCDKCPHSFESDLHHISCGKWCPYCGRSKLCDDSNCCHCFTRSFASNPMSKQWSEKNPDTPRQCARAKNSKRWFDCDKCANSFETSLNTVRGCPHCINKTETILYDFLKSIYPNTIRQFKKDWCKNKKYLPFDFCIPGLKIIIELDGRQHFHEIRHWKTNLEKIRATDLYKEKCATENGFHVIRLLQEDVWNDAYDWKTILQETIETLATLEGDPAINRICRNGEYCEFTHGTHSLIVGRDITGHSAF